MKTLAPESDGRGAEKTLPRIAYKINEAAKIIGVSPITIRRAIDRGLLKPCRSFRHPLIPADQLEKLIGGAA
ncbi:MAG: helix-turn-helix domain-containing protein [Methylacidiphilales bacterium]|nr:helix-turn-helix domain-containing protein [Candidatus Methylacidiphilales bacterium]